MKTTFQEKIFNISICFGYEKVTKLEYEKLNKKPEIKICNI